MQSPGKVSHLLHLLYEAASDAKQWPPFLEALAAEMNATGSSVSALPHNGQPAFHHQFGTRTRASEFEDDHRASIATSEVAGYSTATLSLTRPKSSGPFERSTTNLLRSLTPHLRQALLLHQKFARLHHEASVLEQSLESAATACLILSPSGIVQSLSSAAECLLAECDGISLIRSRLQAASPKEDRALEQILDASSSPVAPPLRGELRITRRIPRKPLHVVVTTHHASREGTPSFIVYLIDPESRTPPRGPLLRSIFGLTPSEAKLADLLAEGHDVKCCAERMRVTEASARFVLKRIFQKTAVKSQSALMRLILSFPSLPHERANLR